MTNAAARTLATVLASKIRRNIASADETYEYEVLVALETASRPAVKAPHSVFDLPVARALWAADQADRRTL